MGEVIWTVIITIGAFIGGIAGNMVSDEASDYCERVTRILLKAAVGRLPTHAQSRYAEEWAAYLTESPGKLTRLAIAIRLYFSALKLATALPPTASPAQQAHLIDIARRLKTVTQVAFDPKWPGLDDVFKKIGINSEEFLNACVGAYEWLSDTAPTMDENTAVELISQIEPKLLEAERAAASLKVAPGTS